MTFVLTDEFIKKNYISEESFLKYPNHRLLQTKIKFLKLKGCLAYVELSDNSGRYIPKWGLEDTHSYIVFSLLKERHSPRKVCEILESIKPGTNISWASHIEETMSTYIHKTIPPQKLRSFYSKTLKEIKATLQPKTTNVVSLANHRTFKPQHTPKNPQVPTTASIF